MKSAPNKNSDDTITTDVNLVHSQSRVISQLQPISARLLSYPHSMRYSFRVAASAL